MHHSTVLPCLPPPPHPKPGSVQMKTPSLRPSRLSLQFMSCLMNSFLSVSPTPEEHGGVSIPPQRNTEVTDPDDQLD